MQLRALSLHFNDSGTNCTVFEILFNFEILIFEISVY